MFENNRVRPAAPASQIAAGLLVGFAGIAWSSASLGSGFGTGASTAMKTASAGVSSISSFASDASLLGTEAAPVVTQLYQSTLAFGGVSFTRLELQVPAAGSLNVRLSDLQFPATAATLSFALTDGAQVLGVINGSGQLLDFAVSGPMTIFAYAYGVASPGFNSAAYSLDISHEMAPVPLPPALLLLLSGLGVTGWLGRRRPRVERIAA